MDALCDDAEDTAPPGELLDLPTRRIVLGVAYDGGPFHGFAEQPGQTTVAGRLADSLERVFGIRSRLVCAGRTDTGVHARSQVVHADIPTAALDRRYGDHEAGELNGLARSLSHQGAPSISVFTAALAPEAFDARHSAIWRRYHYEIDCSGRPDPRLAGSVWNIERPLDVDAMRAGCAPLLGEHDFAAFCRRPPGHLGPITRRVLAATIEELAPGRLRLEIAAVAFCHQMVRSITGVLAAIGKGSATPSDVSRMLESGSRDGAPTIAPALGLCLVAVGYPDELGGPWE